jgi:hypothetical protein
MDCHNPVELLVYLSASSLAGLQGTKMPCKFKEIIYFKQIVNIVNF